MKQYIKCLIKQNISFSIIFVIHCGENMPQGKTQIMLATQYLKSFLVVFGLSNMPQSTNYPVISLLFTI